jgi:hypothetical protein
MSKDLYFEFKAEQLATMYDQTFTKKEAVQTGKNLVVNLFELGEIDPLIVWTNICRLKEVINSADATFRDKINILEKTTLNGVEFNYTNGGETVNLAEDEIYLQLKADLDARAELLKLAQKQQIIDAYGNDVPKVGTTPRKSSISVKF